MKPFLQQLFEGFLSPIMQTIKLSELDQFIICPVCKGYLIDATTVNECLHTFCKSCIVRHIKNDNNDCPKCHTVIHERRPLDYIMHDRNKQDIVYKLVPQLYIKELNKRIAARQTRDIDAVTRLFLAKKFLNVVLSSRKKSSIEGTCSPAESTNIDQQNTNTIYLRCPLTIKICHIRKLLVVKFQLTKIDRVTLFYKGDIVDDEDQISNLAQSLTFCLQYEISRHNADIMQKD